MTPSEPLAESPDGDHASFQERRQFARIPVRMTAWCRPLEHADAPLLLREDWAVGGPGQYAEDLLEKARLPDGVAAFLLHLDAKLDALLGFVLSEKLDKTFPGTLTVLELSGSGLLAQSPTPLSPGDLLEVVLLLHQTPVRLAGAVARVMRVEPSQAAQGGPVLALDFVRIDETALEAVVQFVFSEERKRLRERMRDR